MTSLPKTTAKQLGLVIDLDTCVGCQACVTACKGWNDKGEGLLPDVDAYGAAPSGPFLNRVHSYQITAAPPETAPCAPVEIGASLRVQPAPMIVNFPRSCLHCADAPCVTVCPTGASFKREEDGIVLVNEDRCIGCGLCAWACPYGAREMDEQNGVMKKCTLCVDRIEDLALPEEDRVPACVRTCPSNARHFGDFADPDSAVSKLVAARDGFALMPEMGTSPTNRYLPPRPKGASDAPALVPLMTPMVAANAAAPTGVLGWLDRVLGKI